MVSLVGGGETVTDHEVDFMAFAAREGTPAEDLEDDHRGALRQRAVA